ncbi:MAG: DUF4350 domain-containing protein [Bacillota bacterium]
MSGRSKTLIGLIAFTLAFFIFGCLAVKPDAPDNPPYLSTSADLDGTEAIFLLLKEKGLPVGRWKKSWHFLPAKENHALVAIQPFQVYDGEREFILDWVEQGNHLILFDRHPEGWEFIKTVKTDVEAGAARTIYPGPGSLPGACSGPVETGYRLAGVPGKDVLFYDDYGVLAAKTAYGQGSVTVFLTPEWLENSNILQGSNFDMVWPGFDNNWDALWFDEYHHGLSDSPGLLAVYPDWLVVVLLQLGLSLLAWLWIRGKRFGPAYVPREWMLRRGDETLLAVAGWYESRRLGAEALGLQEKYLRFLAARRWGLAGDATPGELADAARLAWGEEKAGDLEWALSRQDREKGGGVYSKDRLLREMRGLEVLIRALEEV